MKIIKEGRIELLTPDKDEKVFYNPEMELSRDISVSFLRSIGKEITTVCDLLSATGVRAIRYAKETNNIKHVFANDGNKAAIGFIKKNSEMNSVADKIVVSCLGANSFLALHRNKFNFIDIDPFGSPVYFLEELSKSIPAGGYVALTATDCGTLSGIFSKTCFRRYGTKLARTDCFNEIGIRNLIGAAATAFNKQGLSVQPLLSHATSHYFRIFFKIINDKQEPKKFNYCIKCRYCTFEQKKKCDFCDSALSEMGPIWPGDIHHKPLCFSMLDELSAKYFKKSPEARKLMISIIEELGTPFYYNLHDISSRLNINTPSFKKIMSTIKDSGFLATRTHFSDEAIKTDAPLKKLIEFIST